MKKIAFLFSLVASLAVSHSARASVAIMDFQVYQCSDDKDYHAVRHYWGGWGPGHWDLVAFCNVGILKEKSYNGRVMKARDSHKDIAQCQDEDSPAIRACFEEFKKLNGTEGRELEEIKHGKGKKPEVKQPESKPPVRETPVQRWFREHKRVGSPGAAGAAD